MTKQKIHSINSYQSLLKEELIKGNLRLLKCDICIKCKAIIMNAGYAA